MGVELFSEVPFMLFYNAHTHLNFCKKIVLAVLCWLLSSQDYCLTRQGELQMGITLNWRQTRTCWVFYVMHYDMNCWSVFFSLSILAVSLLEFAPWVLLHLCLLSIKSNFMFNNYLCGTNCYQHLPLVPTGQNRTWWNTFRKMKALLWIKSNSVHIKYYDLLTVGMQKWHP